MLRSFLLDSPQAPSRAAKSSTSFAAHRILRLEQSLERRVFGPFTRLRLKLERARFELLSGLDVVPAIFLAASLLNIERVASDRLSNIPLPCSICRLCRTC
jgi:hypothetical protein